MNAIQTLTDRQLLARYNCRTSARRDYARADGLRWHEERLEREANLAEIEALASEWRRRHRGS